jgi:PPOX class probable F420-dependent enzyme
MPRLNDAQAAFLRAGHLAIVTTLRGDGSPHSTPVWIDSDGENVVFNTARGRAKERNLLADARLSVVTVDGGDFHRWLTVDGRAELIDEGADAHIQALADRYQGGVPVQPGSFGAGRVIVRVRPERIEHEGLG